MSEVQIFLKQQLVYVWADDHALILSFDQPCNDLVVLNGAQLSAVIEFLRQHLEKQDDKHDNVVAIFNYQKLCTYAQMYGFDSSDSDGDGGRDGNNVNPPAQIEGDQHPNQFSLSHPLSNSHSPPAQVEGAPPDLNRVDAHVNVNIDVNENVDENDAYVDPILRTILRVMMWMNGLSLFIWCAGFFQQLPWQDSIVLGVVFWSCAIGSVHSVCGNFFGIFDYVQFARLCFDGECLSTTEKLHTFLQLTHATIMQFTVIVLLCINLTSNLFYVIAMLLYLFSTVSFVHMQGYLFYMVCCY
jgi:hypothetical protein